MTGVDPEQLATDDRSPPRSSTRSRLTASSCSRPAPRPEAQVAFCRRLGDVDTRTAPPVPGIYRVTLDKTKNASAAYLLATFAWHIDGCTPDGDECPQKATVLSARSRARG